MALKSLSGVLNSLYYVSSRNPVNKNFFFPFQSHTSAHTHNLPTQNFGYFMKNVKFQLDATM